MATLTLDESIAKIPRLLDRISEEAKTYMSDYIRKNADKGYQTGALASSIDIESRGESARSVGSSLKSASSGFVYGKAVDEGRGPVTAHNPSGRLHYYDPKLGKWVHPKSVKGMSGIGFIAATKNHIEGMNITL